MALEAVVFPQDYHHLFASHNSKEWYPMPGAAWGYYDLLDDGLLLEREEGKEETKRAMALKCEMGTGVAEVCHEQRGGVLLDAQLHGTGWDHPLLAPHHSFEEWDANSSPEAVATDAVVESEGAAEAAAPRRKRRRAKACKNKEEVENQRMTHIAVERNRRKQMNEYLAVLRSLIPSSYVQRGDQASIVGGAINFVKELEQLLQSLEAQKLMKHRQTPAAATASAGDFSSTSPSPFADLFTFAQYSTRPPSAASGSSAAPNEAAAKNRSGIADIEVTMVESHANVKVLSRRRPKQLLGMVVGLQSLCLTVLHLNVTAVDQMVLYSFSVKVEEDSQLNSVDEIAAAVHQLLGRIQEDSGGFN